MPPTAVKNTSQPKTPDVCTLTNWSGREVADFPKSESREVGADFSIDKVTSLKFCSINFTRLKLQYHTAV